MGKRLKKVQKGRKKILNKLLPYKKSKTLTDICKELFDISKGKINGETKSYQQFYNEMREIFLVESNIIPYQIGLILNIKNNIKYCLATHTTWGYDYYIPQTREEEEQLKKETGYYD